MISVGGMLGASARYGVSRWIPTHDGHVPWATLWTNVLGSFALGLLVVLLADRLGLGRHVRMFLTTGLLGAFTTMSTYEVETALLIDGRHWGAAAAYGIGSAAMGLGAAVLGLRLGRRSRSRPPGGRTP